MSTDKALLRLLAPAALIFAVSLPAQAASKAEPKPGAEARYEASRLGPHGELEATRENLELARQTNEQWKPQDRSETYRTMDRTDRRSSTRR